MARPARTGAGAPPGAGGAPPPPALLESTEHVERWYQDFSASLVGRGAVPEPLDDDPTTEARLFDAVSREDLPRENGQAAVRVVWTADHVDAVRRLQGSLVGPARAAAQHRAAS